MANLAFNLFLVGVCIFTHVKYLDFGASVTRALSESEHNEGGSEGMVSFGPVSPGTFGTLADFCVGRSGMKPPGLISPK